MDVTLSPASGGSSNESESKLGPSGAGCNGSYGAGAGSDFGLGALLMLISAMILKKKD